MLPSLWKYCLIPIILKMISNNCQICDLLYIWKPKKMDIKYGIRLQCYTILRVNVTLIFGPMSHYIKWIWDIQFPTI